VNDDARAKANVDVKVSEKDAASIDDAKAKVIGNDVKADESDAKVIGNDAKANGSGGKGTADARSTASADGRVKASDGVRAPTHMRTDACPTESQASKV